MIKNRLKYTAAGILATLLSAHSALALCTAPNLSKPNDLIIQLNSSPSGQSFIGSGAALDVNSATARSKGALYFDSTSDSLVTCDGTNWVSVGSGANGADGSGGACENVPYKYYEVTKTGAWGGGTRNDGGESFTNYANIPVSEQGSSDFTFSLNVSGYNSSGTCYVDIETAGGWKRVGSSSYAQEQGGRGGGAGHNHPVGGTVRVIKNQDGTYTWASPGNFDNIRSLNGPDGAWTGRVRVDPASSNRCQMFLENVERMAGCYGGGGGGGTSGGTSGDTSEPETAGGRGGASSGVHDFQSGWLDMGIPANGKSVSFDVNILGHQSHQCIYVVETTTGEHIYARSVPGSGDLYINATIYADRNSDGTYNWSANGHFEPIFRIDYRNVSGAPTGRFKEYNNNFCRIVINNYKTY